MKRITTVSSMLILLVLLAMRSLAQSAEPVPTLAVPTLVPTVASAQTDTLLSVSAVGDIQSSGKFRAGILYNDPPFGELNTRGELRGFDAEVARLIAETWDVEVEFVQVTRQNALEMLNRGDVDAVFTAFIHQRENDRMVEFSQTYLLGEQSMMVRADSEFEIPTTMINRPLGYVIGTRGEEALQLWAEELGLPLTTQFYVTLDRAYVALVQGEIDGLVAEEQALLRVSRATSDLVKILETSVIVEPRAIAVRRQDVNMRNLLNRTIQYLTDSGELEVLFSEYFPGQDFPSDIIYLWDNIGEEAPQPSQFGVDVQYPAQYTTNRVLESGTLRVAGIIDLPESPTESDIRLDALNRNLVNEFAKRWGVSVQIIPSTPEMGVDMLNSGQADLVVGIQSNWQLADLVDFTTPYLLNGDRLMAETRSNIEGFNELRGQWIATMIGDDTARQRAQAWADSINATVNFYQTTETDAALTILEQDNADVIYANSLSLIPHLEAYPNDLRLTDRWYSREYLSLAVPRNDIDFRLLVDYTMQELIIDGTLERLSSSLILSDELPMFDIWPGASEYAGVNLSS